MQVRHESDWEGVLAAKQTVFAPETGLQRWMDVPGPGVVFRAGWA